MPTDNTTPTEVRRGYQVFLLRLWRADAAGGAWRATLEDPHTGRRYGFSEIAGLIAFLDERTDHSTQPKGAH